MSKNLYGKRIESYSRAGVYDLDEYYKNLKFKREGLNVDLNRNTGREQSPPHIVRHWLRSNFSKREKERLLREKELAKGHLLDRE
jgi:hypothetical protein